MNHLNITTALKQKALKAVQGFIGVLGGVLVFSDQLLPHLSVLIGEERAKKWGAALFLLSIFWRSIMDTKDARTIHAIKQQEERSLPTE